MSRAVPQTDARVCMFCGDALANRGEAYYDHIMARPECEAAWTEWVERLDEDRKSGG